MPFFIFVRTIASLLALVPCIVPVVVLHAAPAAQKKKKAKTKAKKKPAAPAVSPAAKAKAKDQVLESITASATHIENRAALAPFFTRLARASDEPVHILQFGDSHTASDDWVNAMRELFQTRYGNGGTGFVQAGRPFKGYRRFDARGNASLSWVTQGTLSTRGDTMDGLSGLSISSMKAGADISLTAAGAVLTVHSLHQATGGELDLTIDGQTAGTIRTAGPTALGLDKFDLTLPGEHTFELRKADTSPVRLFGWALDYPHGVTVETLGINGAQITLLNEWNDEIWAPAVRQRDPALIVLAYGTNEAVNPKFSPDQYRTDLEAAIAKVRHAAPMSSILLIGPPDCTRAGRPLAHLAEVVEIQKQAAAQASVAYWNLRKWMGGTGSTNLWVRAGLGQQDHIHLTPEGYRLAGKMLFDDLEAAMAEFRGTTTGGQGQEK